MVKVSVIVPVYNVEKYIDRCLNSLVNQTLNDIEIIVVNDGTKDNSQKIIDEYAKKYKNVKSFIKKNGGVSSARNFGLIRACGEYVLLVDGDDFVDYSMIEKMYKKAKEEKWDIVVCNMYKFYDNEKKDIYKCNYGLVDDPIKSYIIGDSGPCSKLIKKSILDKVRFRNIYYEDLDLIPTLVLYTNKIGYIDEELYYYRQIEGSATRQVKFNKRILDIFDVLENVERNLKKLYSSEVEYLYIVHLLRTTSLRLLNFKNTNVYLNEIVNIIKTKYPAYQKNIYYKKSSLKTRIICFLSYNRLWFVLRIIKHIYSK